MAYTSPDLQPSILNSTNYARDHHIAKPLVWNETLADFAQAHSEKCLWEHSGGPYGENLALNFATSADSVDAWANEEKHYNYAKARFSEDTGHFTQLVWRNTTSVGCGAVQCNNTASGGAVGWFLVCEYSPRGNIVGDFKGNVLKPGMTEDGQLGLGSGAGSFRESRSSWWTRAWVGVLMLSFLSVRIL